MSKGYDLIIGSPRLQRARGPEPLGAMGMGIFCQGRKTIKADLDQHPTPAPMAQTTTVAECTVPATTPPNSTPPNSTPTNLTPDIALITDAPPGTATGYVRPPVVPFAWQVRQRNR